MKDLLFWQKNHEGNCVFARMYGQCHRPLWPQTFISIWCKRTCLSLILPNLHQCICAHAGKPLYRSVNVHANIHNLRRKVDLYLRNSGLGLNFFIQREPRPHGPGTSVSSFRFSCPKSMQRAFSLLKARLFPARSFLSSPLFTLSKKTFLLCHIWQCYTVRLSCGLFWVILKPG